MHNKNNKSYYLNVFLRLRNRSGVLRKGPQADIKIIVFISAIQ